MYTVSWETNGGCDPGSGTSGASGSITITVSATNETAAITAASDTNGDGVTNRADLAALALTGNAGQEFITVNDDCTYSLSASLVEDTTKSVCALSGLPAADDADGLPDAPGNAITFGAVTAATDCAPGGLINVAIGDASRAVDTPEEACGADRISGGSNPDTSGPCAAGDATAATIRTAATYKNDGVTAGAIQATGSFVVSATPVPNSKEQCQPASAEAGKNRAGDIAAQLFVTGNSAVVGGSLTPVNCRYDVAIALPAGFTGGASDTHTASDVEADGDDAGLSVAVATRNVYLIQDVDGDSGGAYATYRFTTAATPDDATARCVAGLPGALTATTAGGIVTSTTVELREGRFNINAAVNNGSSGAVAAFAMDHKAVPCHASATVRNLPDHCSASNPTNAVSADLVNDADGEGNVLVEHVITCVEPAAEEPAATDMGDDMGDMGDGGADDMGPPADVATG